MCIYFLTLATILILYTVGSVGNALNLEESYLTGGSVEGEIRHGFFIAISLVRFALTFSVRCSLYAAIFAVSLLCCYIFLNSS